MENLARLIARFKLDGGQSVPRSATLDNRPVASPARALGRRLSNAFSGNAALAAKGDWKEF
ncbi:hypothetical protein [Rhizobium sp. BR 362]|uniref:hypothetical protein n=1 Tax=Rhizobium sp. BR 362 TaxID=3040670 RepID=UPI002F3FAD2F